MTREAVARHDGREMSGYLSPPSRPLSPGEDDRETFEAKIPNSFCRGGVHKVISESPQTRSLVIWRTINDLNATGLENYPYPVMPEGQGTSQLSRTEEKQSLQHLNNRLAGYIDKVILMKHDDDSHDGDE